MDAGVLLYAKRNRIVTITLNRPERLNAINMAMKHELAAAWVRFRDDEDAWACILTGAGDRAFSAGVDLVEEAEMKAQGLERPRPPAYHGLQCWKPKIAAINGHAIAGGFALALDCDIRLAAEHAEFAIPEGRWNMPAPWVYSLNRYVSLGHALELACWGDARLSAQRAYEIGLVNRVVPAERLLEEANAWAERVVRLAPRCVRNLKEIVYRGYQWPSDEGPALASAIEQNLVGMEDSVEGPTAFKEKRTPVFKNR